MVSQAKNGFTIVELLIVIVVIAIIASISVVAYNGVQNRAKNTAVQSDISQVAKRIEIHNAQNGTYPSTGSLHSVYTDSNCSFAVDNDGYKGPEWVPGIGNIPMSPSLSNTGRSGTGGCYAYSSDGTYFILSAWNAIRGGPSTSSLYRRIGFREGGFFGSNQYYCNHNGNIGGVSSGTYAGADFDYYKFSYTISNISNCNETPPTGA